MGLSCECDWGDYEWFYTIEDLTLIGMTRYSCAEGKCYGCGKQIPVGEEVQHLLLVEEDEDGDEDYSHMGRICEWCSDMRENLQELGFCLTADQGFIKNAHQQYIEGDY